MTPKQILKELEKQELTHLLCIMRAADGGINVCWSDTPLELLSLFERSLRVCIDDKMKASFEPIPDNVKGIKK